jgi:hypothetical protein
VGVGVGVLTHAHPPRKDPKFRSLNPFIEKYIPQVRAFLDAVARRADVCVADGPFSDELDDEDDSAAAIDADSAIDTVMRQMAPRAELLESLLYGTAASESERERLLTMSVNVTLIDKLRGMLSSAYTPAAATSSDHEFRALILSGSTLMSIVLSLSLSEACDIADVSGAGEGGGVGWGIDCSAAFALTAPLQSG